MMWPAADFHGFISPFSRTRNTLFPDLITRWSLPRFFFGSCLLHYLIPTFQQSFFFFSFFSKIVSSRVWDVLFHYFEIFFFITKTQNVISWVFLITFYRKQTQFLPILVFSLSKYYRDSNIRRIRNHRSNYNNVKILGPLDSVKYQYSIWYGQPISTSIYFFLLHKSLSARQRNQRSPNEAAIFRMDIICHR